MNQQIQKMCPLISTPDKAAVCQRERCELWCKANDPRYSMCAMRQQANDVHSVRFQLRDALGNVPLKMGQTIRG